MSVTIDLVSSGELSKTKVQIYGCDDCKYGYTLSLMLSDRAINPLVGEQVVCQFPKCGKVITTSWSRSEKLPKVPQYQIIAIAAIYDDNQH